MREQVRTAQFASLQMHMFSFSSKRARLRTLSPAGLCLQVHQLFEQWLRLITAQPGAASFAVNPAAHGVSDAERTSVLGCLNALKNTGELQFGVFYCLL